MRLTGIVGDTFVKVIDWITNVERFESGQEPGSERPPMPERSFLHDPRRRVLDEIQMVAPHFARHGDVDWDPHGDWLMITRYPLPDRWEARWAQLLILFPPAYPATPPLGFYLDRPLPLRNGGRDPHLTGQAYYTAPDLRAHGWEWYCVQAKDGQGGWRPSADWREPDNLWSYMHLIRDSLTNED